MYQFYYADRNEKYAIPVFSDDVRDHFEISAVRPAMWEEHCLECAAPLCFESCVHYSARSDGRCKRFENGLYTFECDKALNGQGVHVKFRKWANMMTVMFPAMLCEEDCKRLSEKNEKLGRVLKLAEKSILPRGLKWQAIRIPEFLRRRSLRALSGEENTADAFVFHGYSHIKDPFNLVVEIYNEENSPVFKTAVSVKHGENLKVITSQLLSPECSKAGNLVKIYPENDIEAEMDILWCDFVKGKPVVKEEPADKVKCVVWDLDGTLWDGILIETENGAGLTLKDSAKKVIEELDKRGIIQSVSSKNDEKAAMEVLEQLGIAEYFLYPSINWNAKSEAVRYIAESLNIGIDSLALVDDSAFERAEVKSVWPQVRVYDSAEIERILDGAEFDVPVTEESVNRRAMYRAEEKRNAKKKASGADISEFIKSCNIKINVFTPEAEEDILRCYELVVRTNQLNMTGVKYTKEEFSKALLREGYKNFAFRCFDDFGDYGIVGFGQYKTDDRILEFSEFAMSCRVAGKFAESALFAYLLKKEDLSEGRFRVVKTKKNTLLRNTLAQIGFKTVEESEDKIKYSFTADLKNCRLVKAE